MHEYALSDLDTLRLLRAVLAALLDGRLSGQRSHATLRAISASHTRKCTFLRGYAKPPYIADASGFPTACGVNPMISVMALAYHVAQGIKARA